MFGQECELEPGVKFFILMLEKLGAVTEWSCEGRPQGFYIVFSAPLDVAKKIHRCGFFSVELEGGTTNGQTRWSLRAHHVHDEQERQMVLRWAATAWANTFGPLTVYSDKPVKKKKHAQRRNVRQN
ncbi:MAG: hypothetical protein EBZ69_00290 [Alphaproteobacteria bacterium]|nr:hypothetical protein [Alphaproteobacteria bacterium]